MLSCYVTEHSNVVLIASLYFVIYSVHITRNIPSQDIDYFNMVAWRHFPSTVCTLILVASYKTNEFVIALTGPLHSILYVGRRIHTKSEIVCDIS
jgi:hypothetical protein